MEPTVYRIQSWPYASQADALGDNAGDSESEHSKNQSPRPVEDIFRDPFMTLCAIV